jgi:hypothetical protein
VPDEVKGCKDELDLFPEVQSVTLEVASRAGSPCAVDPATGVTEANAGATPRVGCHDAG